MVSISARVQHHPARAHLLPALLERLDGLPVEVIEHASDPPSPWAGYRLCLSSPPACSHLLVIQDDAMPVPGFVPALHQIALANPEAPVVLFLSRLPRETSAAAARAMKQNRRYVDLTWRNFMPIVACLWPLAKAQELLAWTDEHPQLPGQREPRSDDAMAGRWKQLTRQTIRVSVPSLVEHPDMEPSLIGRRTAWGKDRGRCAEFLATDALDFDWSQP